MLTPKNLMICFFLFFHSHNISGLFSSQSVRPETIAKMGNFGNKKRNKNRHKKVDIETKSEEESSKEPEQYEKKDDKNDVEKDLDDIDKDEKLQDSELMDMDADMRLQRAVVEKDRGNECFKVKSS